MPEQSQYAAAAHVPLIKSPSLRIPRPIEIPQDIHPLPDDINAYFVFPFTLEQHVLALESSRRSTLAAHSARHTAVLRERADTRTRAAREALRRIAPGFEPEAAPLVPTPVPRPVSSAAGVQIEGGFARVVDSSPATNEGQQGRQERQPDVMNELVDHLAALDAASDVASASTAAQAPAPVQAPGHYSYSYGTSFSSSGRP